MCFGNEGLAQPWKSGPSRLALSEVEGARVKTSRKINRGFSPRLSEHKRKRRNEMFRPMFFLKPEKPYPRTLIFENDNTALLGVGRPIDSAGRNVVKISICFTCGMISFESPASDRIR